MKIIYFLEKSISFNANDLNSNKIAGSEKTLINISNEIAKNNNIKVKVFNNVKHEVNINNVDWIPINKLEEFDIPNVIISMSDMNLFPNYKCKKYLWSHSVQTFEKFIRKNQLVAFLKHTPKIILEGDYHYQKRGWLTSLFGKNIVKICPDYEFIDQKIDKTFVPKKNVIFNTRPDRNIAIVINAWKYIKKMVPDANLYINPPYNLSDQEKNLDIKLREKGEKHQLIDQLINSKLMINPGHKGEVFCLVADEARELCVPIVTYGYGALYERVTNNSTGYICKNFEDLINKSVLILNDDDHYLSLKSNLFKLKGHRTYKDVANDLLKTINI